MIFRLRNFNSQAANEPGYYFNGIRAPKGESRVYSPVNRELAFYFLILNVAYLLLVISDE